MKRPMKRPNAAVATLAVVMMLVGSPGRADVDPAAVEFTAPDDIEWVRNAEGTNETAVLFGDPAKPGPYVMRIKWLPGHMSRPHTHDVDRFFVVISGTWWLGTGDTFDPDSTVPVTAGTYVIHHANQIHYDGAKDGETVIQVWGMGPVSTTPAERQR
jgi:mannose-6-phosphate isomerase-like protein (cupin superfamily)